MADRKAELEKKKQRLEQIRAEKRIRAERQAKEAEDAAKTQRAPKDLREEADEMLSSLGIAPASAVSDITLSSLSSVSSITDSIASSEPSTLPMASSSASSLTYKTAPRKKSNLNLVSVQQTNICPKELVTYNKQTQTVSTSHLDREVLVYDDIGGEDDESSSLPPLEGSPPIYPPKGMPHVEMVKPAQTAAEEKPKEKLIEVKELTDDEKYQIQMTEQYRGFIDRTTRIVERALCEDVDIFIDYAGLEREDVEGDDKTGVKLSLNRCFVDERWSKNRTVTCMDWSVQYPELLLTSYDNNEDSPHDPDGVALIWNMKFKKATPEYIFHSQSPIMSTCFAKFHPNLVIGGTYSGQIVLWDNRSNKRTPIQRSPLSALAHTHPIYCVQVVGTQNAHNLVSISTDGKMCTWSLDMLSNPQDSMDLQQQKQSKAVAVTCLAFPMGSVNNFLVGSEEGNVFSACRHGNKVGIVDLYERHQGPVTAINSHYVQGPIDFSHLFLTSSVDWTVKLWSLKEKKPLYSFEDYGDYVYDIAWSPIHPSLFASVDGMGRLDVWNLNNDTEAPTASAVVDGCPALNRVTWSPSGHQVIAGDDMGKIWIYDVGEQLGVPRLDDWSKFVNTLQELKNNQETNEDIDNVSIGSVGSMAPLR